MTDFFFAQKCTLLWGPSLVLMYNDKYADMAGKEHPRLFGKSGSDAWGEVWDQFGPVSVPVLEGKSAARQDGMLHIPTMTYFIPMTCFSRSDVL